MIVDLLGFGGNFRIDVPTEPLLVGFYILALLAVFFAHQEQGSLSTRAQKSQFQSLFFILLFAGIILAQVLLIRLTSIESSFSIGLRPLQNELFFAVLGALPWLLAAGMLGYREAVLIALAGGIMRAGWGTSSAITPLHIALQAAAVSWMIRGNFSGWLGNSLRNPIIGGLIGGVAFTFLHAFEIFIALDMEFYEGLNTILSNFKNLLIIDTLPLLIAGTGAAFVRMRFQKSWFQARWLEPNPFVRSMTGKLIALFLLLGLFSSTVLITATWFTAHAKAREIVEMQMKDTAREVSSAIPFFIQTGRSLLRRYAADIAPNVGDAPRVVDELEGKLTILPYFSAFTVFNLSEDVVASIGLEGESLEAMNAEFRSALQVALSGVPDELIIEPTLNQSAAQLVFLSPIFSGAENQLAGVLAGWTKLDVNPYLLPSIEGLRAFSSGEGVIVDSQGRIVFRLDPLQLTQKTNLDLSVQGEIEFDDDLSLVYAVEGYPWYVVLTSSQFSIRRLAFDLALPIIGMILILGGLSLGVIYVVIRRLISPLEKIAIAAESIAHGNLGMSIPIGGEDEIGRLSKAFERMRSSLQSRLGEMDLLLAVSQRVASSLDLEEFLPPILNGVHDMTNASLVRLSIVSENSMEGGPSPGFNAGQDPGGWASLDPQIQELCKTRGHFILENPGRARAVLNLDAVTQKLNALVAFPIQTEDTFIGSLWLGYQTAPRFAANEINLLAMIARHLGVAIANAQLYHQGERERARLNTVLHAIPDAVIVTDASGVIRMANPAVEDVLEIDFEQALGKHVEEVFFPPEVTELLLRADRAMATGEVRTGNDRILFYSMTDREISDAAASGKIFVFWDVTQFKKLDTLKSEFVATITKDLTEPLKRMKGYVTMFSKVGTINEQQNEFLSKIMNSTKRMTKLVDNLIDLGKRETGSELKIEGVEVAELIEEVLNAYIPQAAKRQITITQELQTTMRPLQADRLLLQQALANIVDNAIKYSESGSTIIVRADQDQGAQRISVQDWGVGISHPDQARLFEKFYQVRSGGQKLGSGLGLSIVKSIIEQHAGQVHVKSRLGQGSTFTIEIPLHPLNTKNVLDNKAK